MLNTARRLDKEARKNAKTVRRDRRRYTRALFTQNRRNHTLVLTMSDCVAIVLHGIRHRTPMLHLYH